MKDIVEYCDHTIKETGALTNFTEELLKKIQEKKIIRTLKKPFFKKKKQQNALSNNENPRNSTT